jgi:cysteine synthase B
VNPLATLGAPSRRRDVLSAIGSTPLVELPSLRPEGGARLWAKLEQANPTGSVKDRVALSLIEAAERDGLLRPGQTVLEPTSGNTGISLAMVCQVKGYVLRAVMPESATPERAQMLRMYGAEIVWSPGEEGSNGAVRLARELAARDASVYMPFQYGNPANPEAHYRGTGPEILAALDGQVDAFVAGLGTGGTLMGTGRALREARPGVQIIAAEPLQGDSVMGLRSLDDGYTPEILDITQLDRKLLVSNPEAVRGLRDLLEKEGLWVGVSAGAVLAVGRRVAASMAPDQNVVMLFADGGWKYASAGLWSRDEDELEEEMESRLWW